MARKTRYSTFDLLRPVLQVGLCASGLLGGLIMGAVIVYATGLWSKFAIVMNTPFDEMTTQDMLVGCGSILIVFACGWLGAKVGLALMTKLQP